MQKIWVRAQDRGERDRQLDRRRTEDRSQARGSDTSSGRSTAARRSQVDDLRAIRASNQAEQQLLGELNENERIQLRGLLRRIAAAPR